MKLHHALALVAILLPACTAHSGTLGGRWVYTSPGGVGLASAPQRGTPLTVAGTSNGCIKRSELTRHFGHECTAHETEGGGATIMTDDVPLGPQPTPGEVLWYCDCHTVVRVVLARCGGTDEFSVSQLAVTIDGR